LGRPYEISGIVAHGEQMGRQIGFPTANISIDTHRMIPKRGVYAVKVSSPLGSAASQWEELSTQFGMTNIGMRPTFDGHRLTIETHIFDFHEDLYGRQLTIQFMARLRDEQSFESAEALALQMQHDEQQARKILTPHP
jgi:riboflavin kinase/FMN adenylyltransferase